MVLIYSLAFLSASVLWAAAFWSISCLAFSFKAILLSTSAFIEAASLSVVILAVSALISPYFNCSVAYFSVFLACQKFYMLVKLSLVINFYGYQSQ